VRLSLSLTHSLTHTHTHTHTLPLMHHHPRLQGTTVTLLTKTAVRYEGVIISTSGEGDTIGVTLKDAKEISNPTAPIKDQLFIASTNIDTWSSGPADAKVPNGSASDGVFLSLSFPPSLSYFPPLHSALALLNLLLLEIFM
jgi:hypothetical protein